MINTSFINAYVGVTTIKEVRHGGRLVLAPNGNKLWYDSNELPSLDLRFAEDKSLVDATTGSNLVDFTRASSGTYVGSDGLIKTAVTNLLLQSEDFSTTWTNSESSETVNAAIAPDGTLTADALVDTVVNTSHSISQGIATLSANTSYTFSCWIKKGSKNFAAIFFSNNAAWGSGGGALAYFDLLNGQVLGTGNATSSIQAYPNGWYRCTATATTSSSPASAAITIRPSADGASSAYAGSADDAIYIWGAQLEQSTTVGEYVKTTSTINSAPRFDHDPTTGESLGLLVEESRTNLLLQSEDFSTTWGQSFVTVDANSEIAPNGTQTADKIIPNNGESSTYVNQSIAFVAGSSYTFSVYAKAGELDSFRWVLLAPVGGGTLAFNLTLGQATAMSGAWTTNSITPVGNGWYRLTGTMVSIATTTSAPRWVIFATGDGTSGLYLWGAQLEAGSFPTSYIPTEGSTVTRAADVASISGSNFSSWYRQDEGTVLIGGVTAPALSRFPSDWSLNDGTAANRIEAYNFTSGYYVTVRKTGETTVDPAILTAPVSGASYKKAVAIQANSYRLGVNGQQGANVNPSFVPTVDRLTIGTSWNAAGNINSTISRLTYWPQRLPNETLQTITQ